MSSLPCIAHPNGNLIACSVRACVDDVAVVWEHDRRNGYCEVHRHLVKRAQGDPPGTEEAQAFVQIVDLLCDAMAVDETGAVGSALAFAAKRARLLRQPDGRWMTPEEFGRLAAAAFAAMICPACDGGDAGGYDCKACTGTGFKDQGPEAKLP